MSEPTSLISVGPSSGTSRRFEAESYWPPENPNYAHFKTAGGATFAVMEAPGRGARFNFTVDDPDSLWERVEDSVTVVEPLFDIPYGTASSRSRTRTATSWASYGTADSSPVTIVLDA